MQGFQVTFFTQQDRMHQQTPLAQWLLGTAKQLGIRGATLNGALQGLGHDGSLHAINMFDLSDQPIQVTLVVNEEELQRLSERLQHEHVQLFYVKNPVEFGILGEDSTSLFPVSPPRT